MHRGVKIAIVVVAAVVMAALSVAYYAIDPASSSFMPQCLFKTITGWDCPGCGSQRMLHALLHGDFIAAWQYNPFLLAISPFLLLLLYAAMTRNSHPRLYARLNSPAVIITLLVLLLLWSVLRNL